MSGTQMELAHVVHAEGSKGKYGRRALKHESFELLCKAGETDAYGYVGSGLSVGSMENNLFIRRVRVSRISE